MPTKIKTPRIGRKRTSLSTFRKSKACLEGENMPAGLIHQQPGEPFDVMKSEVIQWIAGNPVMLTYLFQRLYEAGAIVFDSGSRTWSGLENTPLRKILASLSDSDRQEPH